jgi:hypothetical protein
MNESEVRSELYDALRYLSQIASEMRAGQLMAAIGERCADLHGRGLWDASDTELLEAVWHFRRDFETATADRRSDSTEAAMPNSSRSVNDVA